MDKLDAIKIFLRVAELRSFTKAAESLNLPKASVSTSVQNLEELLGTKLLHRTTRTVQVSAEGIAFYERSKDLLAEFDEAESMFRGQGAKVQGKVRVDLTAAMACNFLLPRLPKLLEKHPNLEIEISSSDRTVDLLREGLDCVLRSSPSSEGGIEEKEVGQLALVNCASPAYFTTFGTPRTLEDLKRHRLVFYTPTLGGKVDGFEYFDGEKYREIPMAGSISVNSTDAYRTAALQGFGIIQVPLVGVSTFLKSGKLVECLPKHKAAPLPMRLVFPRRRVLPQRVRIFQEWLEKEISDYLRSLK